MNKQYEVLHTITNAGVNHYCSFQRFTNKEGKIFLISLNGMVSCFDPLGDKQLTEVLDLAQDYS